MRQRPEDLDETGSPDAVPDRVEPPEPPGASQVARGAVAALCVTAALTHVLLVFLHVAPSNPISQHYDKQITAWVYPLFEQRWRLFAPTPASRNTQIFARTGWTSAVGDRHVSDWFDISAVDNADLRHNPFPSHATQNMLRLAWNAYVTTHGKGDVSKNEWALMRAKYLRNIAVQRVAPHSPRPFEAIRLMVVRQPIPPPSAGARARTGPTDPVTRLLPWWNVTPDGS